MTLSDFLQHHGKSTKLRELAHLPRSAYPPELRKATLDYMNYWKECCPIEDLMELSGLNDMTLNDLARYARNELPTEEFPEGYHKPRKMVDE